MLNEADKGLTIIVKRRGEISIIIDSIKVKVLNFILKLFKTKNQVFKVKFNMEKKTKEDPFFKKEDLEEE